MRVSWRKPEARAARDFVVLLLSETDWTREDSKRANSENREPSRGAPLLGAPRAVEVLFTNGNARSCSHFAQDNSIPKQLLFGRSLYCHQPSCGLFFKMFLKANVKPNKPFIFEHETPSFSRVSKQLTRQERCSVRVSPRCRGGACRVTANSDEIQCLQRRNETSKV
jgi:hypothetical protein